MVSEPSVAPPAARPRPQDPQGPSPRPGATCRSLTGLADELLRAIYESEAGSTAGVALVAVCGYGRRELCPGSDLDLALVYGDEPARPEAERAAGAVCRALRDLGKELGHPVVRSVGSVERTFDEDVPSATALTDARHVAGDPDASAALEGRMATLMRERGVGLLEAKVAELERLHARYGASPYGLEPHVKAGAGGLRDLELLALFQRAGDPPVGCCLGLDAAELAVLDGERQRLLDIRCAMHLVEGRREDLLRKDLQVEVAKLLLKGGAARDPVVHAEAFMRRHFEGAARIERALGLARKGLAARTRATTAPPTVLHVTKEGPP